MSGKRISRKKDDRQNDRPVRKQVSARHKEEGHYSALKAYADKRLDKCVFGEEKPACKQCPVHCYQPARREEMKQVMRWAGPRMLWRHPILTIRHLIDDRRPVPELPEKYRPKNNRLSAAVDDKSRSGRRRGAGRQKKSTKYPCASAGAICTR